MKKLFFALLFCSFCSGVMLLKVYDDRDIAGWVASEKYDGVRALWDGQTLRSRQGKIFCAPSSFLSQLPPFALDGELWAGRGEFEKTTSITASCDERWGELKYMVFDVPFESGGLLKRLGVLRDFLATHKVEQIKIIEQIPLKDKNEAYALLDELSAKGAEGIVVRDPNAPYKHGRQDSILKLKKFKDAECKITKIIPRSDDENAIGAVFCQDLESKESFKIGSGFGKLTNCEQNPQPKCLKKGDIITYKYQNLTKNNKPRFASFLRKKD